MNIRILGTIALGALLLFSLTWTGCSSDDSIEIVTPVSTDNSLSTGFSDDTDDNWNDYPYNTDSDEDSLPGSGNSTDKYPEEDDWDPDNPKNEDEGK